jgi:hypothetical protein
MSLKNKRRGRILARQIWQTGISSCPGKIKKSRKGTKSLSRLFIFRQPSTVNRQPSTAGVVGSTNWREKKLKYQCQFQYQCQYRTQKRLVGYRYRLFLRIAIAIVIAIDIIPVLIIQKQ